jgi:pilus assembly protein CpaB
MFKNRTLIGVICLVIALLVSFVVAPQFAKIQSKQENIVVASGDIIKGDLITKEDVVTKKIGSYNLPEDIFKETEAVVGQYAKTDIPSGDIILGSKISENPGDNSYLANLDENKTAVSLTINSFAAGLSGKLQPGDVVQVLSVDSAGAAIAPNELRYVNVLAATSETGSDVERTTTGEDGRIQTYGTVTLEVSQAQLKKIVEFEDASKIHMALVYRGSNSTAESYLEAQERALGGM